MNADQSLARFGLVPKDEDLPEIREVLAREADAERRGRARTEDLALLCCVQLFSRGHLEDVERIWDAKTAGMDLGALLDVQLLCGAGLERTKAYLASRGSDAARAALDCIARCEDSDDFEDFTPEAHLDRYRRYFGVVR